MRVVRPDILDPSRLLWFLLIYSLSDRVDSHSHLSTVDPVVLFKSTSIFNLHEHYWFRLSLHSLIGILLVVDITYMIIIIRISIVISRYLLHFLLDLLLQIVIPSDGPRDSELS